MPFEFLTSSFSAVSPLSHIPTRRVFLVFHYKHKEIELCFEALFALPIKMALLYVILLTTLKERAS